MYVAEHFSLPGDQVRQLLARTGAADLVTVHEGARSPRTCRSCSIPTPVSTAP